MTIRKLVEADDNSVVNAMAKNRARIDDLQKQVEKHQQRLNQAKGKGDRGQVALHQQALYILQNQLNTAHAEYAKAKSKFEH